MSTLRFTATEVALHRVSQRCSPTGQIGRALRAAVVLTALVAGGCAKQRRADIPDGASPMGAQVSGESSGQQRAVGRFVRTLDSLRLAADIPGLSVAVVANGVIVMSRGFGHADIESRRAADGDTPYNIASVSKPISAVVALLLVEKKQLDLDQPMASYKEFTEFCTGTREQGGIFFGDFACDTRPGIPPLTMRHVLSMTMNGSPERRFFYNPPAYSWASRPMAEVSGKPFSTLVDELVFQPAGMKRSARIHRRLPLRADIVEALATPYHHDSTATDRRLVRSTPPPPQGDGAGGGVASTANDLARFDIALDAGRLLSDSLRALMWQPARTSAGLVAPYGLGWFVQDICGRRVVWHTGLWEGRYSALYLKIPAERLTVILLANSDGLQWSQPLDGADIRRSAFARSFFELAASRSR
ncbi:MAG: beta-lactamase family protein [Gemmatimonadota bacterium]|nr:beta-lactamase family protein [Gemmatimonadota bacterium]